MADPTPSKAWWSTREIAEARLPSMPTTRQGVDHLADEEQWRSQPEFARRREGRGGGWEYHWHLFPSLAQRSIAMESARSRPVPEPRQNRGEAWSWFEGLPDKTKAKAKQRLEIIQAVEMLVGGGQSKFLAVVFVAKANGVSERTIWNWFEMIEGVRLDDRLPYLAPRHRARRNTTPKAQCSLDWWEVLKADYLRKEKRVSFSSAYRRSLRIAEANGWSVLPERTARRRLDELVPRVSQIFAREGVSGLERCYPPQVRDRTDMVAMEGINADTHRIDVFVEWEDGTVDRPQIVAYQDIYSGKILSFRVDHTPNKVAVMAAFGDMIEEYGIPQRILFDNGREFANKWMTGGTETRFRFKVREDDPLGVLPMMGIEINWARPYSGRSKPIERAFRDFSLDIALDPRFAGAYTGNLPTEKPENYRSRAVPISEFLKVLEEGVAEHNARPGRRSPTCMGRSFDETFAESYANAPVRKATDEQRRLWLMGQETRKLDANSGRFRLYENVYWSDWMAEVAGKQVVIRFDPEDLHVGAYVYDLDGTFLGFAACQQKAGFFSAAAGKDEARKVAAFRRKHKQMLEAERTLSARDVGEMLNAIPREELCAPEAKVVRPEFGAGRGKSPLVDRPMPTPSNDAEAEASHAAFVAEFRPMQRQAEPLETEYDRFRRALTLEERQASGGMVGEEEARWLAVYQAQPEYRSLARLYEDFGDALFAE